MAIRKRSKEQSMGKKGYFFTLAVVLILVLVTLVIKAKNSPGYTQQSDVSTQRILEIDRYITAVEGDIGLALRTTGLRSFLAIEANITKNEGYIKENFTEIFQTIILNGTYKGKNLSLMNQSTLKDWNLSIYATGNRIGIQSYFRTMNVSVWQDGHWTIGLLFNGTFFVSDPTRHVSWEKDYLKYQTLPVEFFLDPVYTVGTQSTYFQRISKTNYSDTFPGNLTLHIEQHLYIATNKSPGYLQRLQGNFSGPFIYGIESLVDVATLSTYGYEKDLPIVDWQYFTDQNQNDCELVPSWVKIPKDRKNEYNFDLSICVGYNPCGNGVCEASEGEDFVTCLVDCHCGDENCQSGLGETTLTCPADCTPKPPKPKCPPFCDVEEG